MLTSSSNHKNSAFGDSGQHATECDSNFTRLTLSE
jgi:hypothetical protein